MNDDDIPTIEVKADGPIGLLSEEDNEVFLDIMINGSTDVSRDENGEETYFWSYPFTVEAEADLLNGFSMNNYWNEAGK
jgi:hypothetical protein